jgi:hypothetical protein
LNNYGDEKGDITLETVGEGEVTRRARAGGREGAVAKAWQ